MSKKILFSITKKDFKIDYFCTGGPGGQKQNKTASGCRITHEASGAVGECRNHRSQDQNRKEAFKRLTDSSKFKIWLKVKISAVEQGFRDIDEYVDSMMTEDKIKVEYPGDTE